MQTRRHLFAVLAAMTTAAVLISGCSSSSKSSSKPLPDAATLVKQSSQATKNVKSVHLVLSTTGKVPGLPIKTLTGDLTTNPTAAKGNAKITIGGSDIDADFVVYDSNLYATLTPNKWDNFGPAADIYDPSTILNPDTGLANVLAHLSDPRPRRERASTAKTLSASPARCRPTR
ncbi:lipoprotein lprG [Mycobacterium xenopi 3993]|nr:lipoprotein lprG [Mycobacterium xenopi 3993]